MSLCPSTPLDTLKPIKPIKMTQSKFVSEVEEEVWVLGAVAIAYGEAGRTEDGVVIV